MLPRPIPRMSQFDFARRVRALPPALSNTSPDSWMVAGGLLLVGFTKVPMARFSRVERTLATLAAQRLDSAS